MREMGNTLRERLTGHPYAIDHRLDIPVAQHFLQLAHSSSVSVIQSTLEDLLKRLTVECGWIARFRNNSDYLLNRNDGHEILLL